MDHLYPKSRSRFYSATKQPVAVEVALFPGTDIEKRTDIHTLPLAAAENLPDGYFLTVDDDILRGIQEVCSGALLGLLEHVVLLS